MRDLTKTIACAAIFTLAACTGGTTTNPVFIVPTAAPTTAPAPPPAVTITPATGLQMTAAGQTQTFTASESGYTGTFTASSANCAGVATFTPASASGPSASFSVTATAAGTCQISVKDSNNVVGVVNVSVNPSGGAAPNPLVLSTGALAFTVAGTTATFTASETGYGGALTAANGTPSCAGIATFSPAAGTGPSTTFTVTAVAAGTCQVKVTDTNGQTAVVNVTVTTTGGSIS